MQTNITITRSKAWVHARRLETGDNTPETIDVAVDVAQLSAEARALLLNACNGQYPTSFSGAFNIDYEFSSGWGYGRIPLIADCDEPTVAEIDAALLEAAKTLTAKKAERDEEQRLRKEQERALAAEWSAFPLSQRATADGVCYCVMDGVLSSSGGVKYPVSVLKEYAPEAYAEAVAEYSRMRELAAGRRAIKDREVLAEFLSSIPEDALRGALKALAHSDEALEQLRAKIEDASPDIQIFSDDE